MDLRRTERIREQVKGGIMFTILSIGCRLQADRWRHARTVPDFRKNRLKKRKILQELRRQARYDPPQGGRVST
jgi:hypothetical protein